MREVVVERFGGDDSRTPRDLGCLLRRYGLDSKTGFVVVVVVVVGSASLPYHRWETHADHSVSVSCLAWLWSPPTFCPG